MELDRSSSFLYREIDVSDKAGLLCFSLRDDCLPITAVMMMVMRIIKPHDTVTLIAHYECQTLLPIHLILTALLRQAKLFQHKQQHSFTTFNSSPEMCE
jgi:hypothetical protein